MNQKDKVRVEVRSLIGEGVHTSLRKYCNSPYATKAWAAIRDMSSGEWGNVCDIVTDYLLEQYDIKPKRKRR